VKPLDAGIEPLFQSRSPLSPGKEKYAESNFTENNGVDSNVPFV
jgi:hypothetical protein